MVSALQDLRNRIASNTLTGPQQAALDTALDVLIPLFPTPDELSNSIPQTEELLAREWIAPLYSLQAQAGPGGGVLPTTEIAFFINPATGSDTNDGLTPSTALKTIAALGALWRGTAGGGRPVLAPATGTTVTVTIENDAPLSDPLAPILDVDITGGASLVIVGAPKAAAHTGVVATANAWARTVANGQVRITDAAVANYAAFVGVASLFVDDTSNCVAWLYGPDSGASATGTMTVGYGPPQTAGVASAPAQTNITAADAYTLADPVHAALGNGFVTRSFPSDGSSSVAEASVFFYRLRLGNPGTNPVCAFQSPTVTYMLQECMYDTVELQNVISGLSLVNCFGYHSIGIATEAGGFTEVLAGGLSGEASGTILAAGGTVIVDLDHALFSGAPYDVSANATMQIGMASRWNNAGSQALNVIGGTLIVAPALGALGKVYGTDAGGDFATIGSVSGNAGAILYVNDSSGTPAGDAFVFTDTAFTMGTLGASGFGLSQTTGLAVGPTTNTLAHLDAAIGAGTGFGGAAVDPRSGSTFRIDS